MIFIFCLFVIDINDLGKGISLDLDVHVFEYKIIKKNSEQVNGKIKMLIRFLTFALPFLENENNSFC